MSDCSCIYVDVDSPDTANEYAEETIKAAGGEKCNECKRQMVSGEEHELHTLTWFHLDEFDEYGEVDRCEKYITCPDCLSIRDEFFCEGWYFGSILEYLYEHVREMEGKISEECLDNLTPKAKDVVLGYIDEIFEELNREEEDD